MSVRYVTVVAIARTPVYAVSSGLVGSNHPVVARCKPSLASTRTTQFETLGTTYGQPVTDTVSTVSPIFTRSLIVEGLVVCVRLTDGVVVPIRFSTSGRHNIEKCLVSSVSPNSVYTKITEH